MESYLWLNTLLEGQWLWMEKTILSDSGRRSCPRDSGKVVWTQTLIRDTDPRSTELMGITATTWLIFWVDSGALIVTRDISLSATQIPVRTVGNATLHYTMCSSDHNSGGIKRIS